MKVIANLSKVVFLILVFSIFVTSVSFGQSEGTVKSSTVLPKSVSYNFASLSSNTGHLFGPVYPPPLGLVHTESGVPNDGSIGRASGKDWFNSSVTLAGLTTVYWGAVNDSVMLSFNDSVYSDSTFSEIMTFRSDLSDTSGGVLVWAGETRLPGDTVTPIYTRLTVTVTEQDSVTSLSLTDAQALGLPADVGAVLAVTSGLAYQANLKLSASFDSTTGFSPSLDFYDLNTTADSTAYTSVSFGFYWENVAPTLNINSPLTVDEGTSGVITNSLLKASDVESPTTGITFTVAPDSIGQPPQNGSLKLNGVPLDYNDTFTQENIDNNQVTYEHDGSETTSDLFVFNVMDEEGELASNAGFTEFSFLITITPVNDPPVANDSSYTTNIGGSFSDTLKATDPDSPTLTYLITNNGLLGTATILDANAGTFSYTGMPDSIGIDTFNFSVSDGILADTGTITVEIINAPPIATDDSGVTSEDVPFGDTLSATDPESQPLNYLIQVNGTKGSAVITDASVGAFTYTPDPDAIGADSFTFVADDGVSSSNIATYYVTISPIIEVDDILITNSNPALIVIDPAIVQQGVFSSGGFFTDLRGITIATVGNTLVNIFVMDGGNGIISVNPTTGTQLIVSAGSNFSTAPIGPIGIALEAAGTILVADGTNGLVRVDSSSGVVTVLSSGGSLKLPVGVVVDLNGTIFVSDAGAFLGDTSRVIRINPLSGSQTVISKGNNLLVPIGIALESDGSILISDASTAAGGPADLVIRIDTATGNQTVLTSNDLLNFPSDIAVARNGDIYAVSRGDTSIVEIDPSTGIQNLFISSGYLTEPWGIALFESCCNGNRGDANGDGSSDPNILDLTFLVDYIFRNSGEPGICLEESDVNGDGNFSNILDLTYLVDFIFRSGPPTGPC